jgi:hypothetical protein
MEESARLSEELSVKEALERSKREQGERNKVISNDYKANFSISINSFHIRPLKTSNSN